MEVFNLTRSQKTSWERFRVGNAHLSSAKSWVNHWGGISGLCQNFFGGTLWFFWKILVSKRFKHQARFSLCYRDNLKFLGTCLFLVLTPVEKCKISWIVAREKNSRNYFVIIETENLATQNWSFSRKAQPKSTKSRGNSLLFLHTPSKMKLDF